MKLPGRYPTGSLSGSSDSLYAFLCYLRDTEMEAERIGSWAYLSYEADSSNPDVQKRMMMYQNAASSFAEDISWYSTELVSIDDEKILQLPDFKEKNQPEKSLEKTDLREEIDIALNMISEEHRKVVILRDVAGMKYSDIAKALSIEEGTVKSRIARARSALRKILIDRGNISLPSSSKQSERRREDAKL